MVLEPASRIFPWSFPGEFRSAFCFPFLSKHPPLTSVVPKTTMSAQVLLVLAVGVFLKRSVIVFIYTNIRNPGGLPADPHAPRQPNAAHNVVCRLSVMNASIRAFGSLHISSKSSVPHSASCFFTPARLQIVVKTNRHGRVFCHFNKCTRAGYIYE